jgi:uncharacterized damage-inducible protein DinB
MNDIILKEFKENAVFRLDESLRMITIAFSKIADDMLWKRPTEQGMALGNQILHSCGNMTQYVCTSLAERVDERKRDLEFSTNTGLTKEELLKQLETTVRTAQDTIHNATALQYETVREVQGFRLSGVGVVLHAVEHFSYHTGQIAFWVKQLTQEDLGFYAGVDLTQNNK